MPERAECLRIDEKDILIANLRNHIKQLSQKLNDVCETNAKFISIIAHDLRSPFCSILMSLDYLKMNMGQNDVIANGNLIDDTADSVHSTLDLLDDLLKWTISQNKEKSFNPEKFNLFKFLNEEIKNLRTLAIQKHISLTLMDTSCGSVEADIRMVRTILRNLIGNAVKYTRAGGEVKVSSRNSGQFVEIEVEDTGIGISQNIRENLFKFDPYKSQPGTSNEKGTGLGLLLCKDFVEMHGGRISVASEPGKGSIFGFTMKRFNDKSIAVH